MHKFPSLLAGAIVASPALAASKPTVGEAERFVADAEAELEKMGINAQRAEWVAENFISGDTAPSRRRPMSSSWP